VEAFIEGAQSDRRNRVLTTAKHFPGHGDTATDTHLGLATIPADRNRLNQVELVPFRAAVAKGVDAIMTAHVAVPALGSDNPQSMRMAVVFPAPLAPRNPNISPFSTSKEILSTAVKAPNFFVKATAVITFSVAICSYLKIIFIPLHPTLSKIKSITGINH